MEASPQGSGPPPFAPPPRENFPAHIGLLLCVREPLLLPLVAVVAGILLGEALDFSVRETAWPMLAFAALAAAPASKWTRATAGTLALVCAGAFLLAWRQPTREPYLDVAPREVVILEGCVVEPTVFANDRAQFTLELEPGARAQVQVPAYAEQDHPPRLSYGQRVAIEARVRPPHNFGNPGAFDYAAYLARSDIYWTALVPAAAEARSVRVLPGRCGSRFFAAVFALRTAALDRIDRLFAHDEYARAMLEAVLIGESAHLERVWTDDFRRSGTYHALVISGLHVSILAMVLLGLLRFAPVSTSSALAITAAVAWTYALVSGFSVPVVRAAGGLTLYLVARLFFRRTRILNLISALALGYLAWDPTELFEASFQLSFLSVAAIGALAAPLLEATTGPLARGLRSITNVDIDPHLEPRVAQFRVEVRLAAETLALWTRVPFDWCARALALATRLALFAFELAAISATIQIGLALPMAEYFHRISFTGLTANLAIVPLMNAIVPLGFLALFSGWHWAAALAGTFLSWSRNVAAWHAGIDPGWRVPDPPVWLALAFVAALVAAAVSFRHRTVHKALHWPAVACVLVLLALMIRSPWPADIHPGQLELTAIDVGQGDSLLVVFPEGATMLVDGGGRLSYGRPRPSNLDIGEDVVSPYLWTRGIRHLDILVATHSHQDHIGGLTAVLENFHPDELWTGANPPAALVARARSEGVRIREPRTEPAFPFSGATIKVLAPDPAYTAREPGNNDSLALRLTYGSRSFLLTGDLERPIENQLLAEGAIGHTDVLKVAHHGSRTSSTEAFLDAASPAIALISAGYENSFGHPHPDVLARLEALHTTVLRTDLGGLATARTDGSRLWFDTSSWHRNTHRIVLPAHLIY